MRLKGRTALVTGASRGIGKAIALALGAEGVNVVAAAKTVQPDPRLPGTIGETVAEIEARGGRGLAVACDVRFAEQIESAVGRGTEAFGGIDILVNNAGALWWQPVLQTPARRFDLVMAVNARASFLMAREVLPGMIERGWGHIVNMSPPIEERHLPGRVAYMISKYGMTMLTLGLAEEVREHDVAVNSLWPVTIIESQASIGHQLGGPELWRKADIMADATLAILRSRPSSCTGRVLTDEQILRENGVTDFARYACVSGTNPPAIESFWS